MPKQMKNAPKDYWDMKDSVEKSKKVTQKEVFGTTSGRNAQPKNASKNKKKLTKKKSKY